MEAGDEADILGIYSALGLASTGWAVNRSNISGPTACPGGGGRISGGLGYFLFSRARTRADSHLAGFLEFIQEAASTDSTRVFFPGPKAFP